MDNQKLSQLDCKVVILAGGFGTRLKEETEFRPKPMVNIGDKPILWHIMQIYARAGYYDFIIAGGYKVEMIKEYFLNFLPMNNDIRVDLKSNRVEILSSESYNFTITVIDTGLRTMTGGRIKRLQKYIGNSRFMVTYGDGVADVDVRKIMDFHLSHMRLATVTGVRPSSRFGELDITENLVTSFLEKPQLHSSYINGGFFVFEPKIFDYIEGDATLLESEVLHKLSQQGYLAIYKHDGFWKCMDTYKDMNELNALWDSGDVKWLK